MSKIERRFVDLKNNDYRLLYEKDYTWFIWTAKIKELNKKNLIKFYF